MRGTTKVIQSSKENLPQIPEVLWSPNPGPQTDVLRYRVYELLYGGARGGGKTDAGIAFLLLDDYHLNPKYRALVIRKNADDLRDWTDRAERLYANEGARKVGGGSSPAVFLFPSGAKIITGHLKDSEAYTKYQGHEYQRMLLEELTQIARETDYVTLIGSCRSTVPGLVPGIFATTNPNGKGHSWVKKRFVSGEDVPIPGTIWIPETTKRPRLYIPASVYDNPVLVKNDPGYIDYLDGLPPKLREAWLLGSWDVGAGEFFEEWDTKIHVCKPFEIPKHWKRYISIDYGYSAPSAVYWHAVNPITGKVYTYREIYVTQHTGEMLAQSIHAANEGDEIEWIVADNNIANVGQEAGISIYGQFQNVFEEVKWDVPIRLARKGPNSRVNGWNLMRGYLKRTVSDNSDEVVRWQVFPNCVKLIETMPLQIYEDPNTSEDLDTDMEDHAQDSCRYFLQTLNEPFEKEPPKPKKEVIKQTINAEQLLQKMQNEYGDIMY